MSEEIIGEVKTVKELDEHQELYCQIAEQVWNLEQLLLEVK